MILYRDQDWLAVDKPTGLATHGGHAGELGAVEWLALHLGLEAFVVSRLDAGTSGVLWLALSREASGRAQLVHEAGAALKSYVFLSAADSRAAGLPDLWTRNDALDDRPACTAFRRDSEPGPGGLTRYVAEIARGCRHQWGGEAGAKRGVYQRQRIIILCGLLLAEIGKGISESTLFLSFTKY